MSSGYSMKHIGVTIVVTLIVLVLISPLMQPKNAAMPSRKVTQELREVVGEYRAKMAKQAQTAAAGYEAGTLTRGKLLRVKMAADLAVLEELSLDTAAGHGGAATRAVVVASYWKESYVLDQAMQAATGAEDTQVTEAYFHSQIERIQRMAEVNGNKAFMAAYAAWEKERSLENLQRMFDAEMNL